MRLVTELQGHNSLYAPSPPPPLPSEWAQHAMCTQSQGYRDIRSVSHDQSKEGCARSQGCRDINDILHDDFNQGGPTALILHDYGSILTG